MSAIFLCVLKGLWYALLQSFPTSRHKYNYKLDIVTNIKMNILFIPIILYIYIYTHYIYICVCIYIFIHTHVNLEYNKIK